MNNMMLNNFSSAAVNSLKIPVGNNTTMHVNHLEWDCYSPYMIITNGIWLGDDPMQYSLPIFLTQLLLITLTSRSLHLLLKPFKQTMVLAEMLTGLVLGPSLMGTAFKQFRKVFFPPRSIGLLSSVGNIGLLLYVFMVGVETDMRIVKEQLRKKVIAISTASIIIPFAITLLVAYAFRKHIDKNDDTHNAIYIYLAVSLSVTSLPVLARLLRELKLVNSDIGRISLSSTVITDLLSWLLLALTISFTGTTEQSYIGDYEVKASVIGTLAPYIVLCSLGFMVFCNIVVKPALEWFMLHKTPEGEPVSDMDLGIVIMGVMVAGFITDIIGVHAIFGAFIFGLIIPRGTQGTLLIEKLENIVTGLLMPIYFANTGFKANLFMIKNSEVCTFLIFIIILSSIVKVLTTTIISSYFGMHVMEGLSLGCLMSSQGLVEVILLNIARDKYVVSEETYAVLLVMSIVMTALVTPIVAGTYKPTRRMALYKHHMLMGTNPDKELRMLACIYSNRNIPSIISLLDMSNPTKRSPIFVCALHLIELTGWATPMIIVHDNNSSNINQTPSEHFIAAFEAYEQHAGGISVQPITAIAPYNKMHDDICTLAGDKHSALIIIPFHKIHTVDGGEMEATNQAILAVNQNILNHSPCSVGILVDHGLSTVKADYQTARHVVVLFFGGPDDREALAYASRMARHPNVNLTVIRFILVKAATTTTPPPISPLQQPSFKANEMLQQYSSVIDMDNLEDGEKDQVIDDAYISEFRLKNIENESIHYEERVVNNSEETVVAIRSLDCKQGLYMVGRSLGMSSPLTMGLSEWMECPELGPIGDLLASADLGEAMSVLVIQQYRKVGNHEGGSHVNVNVNVVPAATVVWRDSPWKSCKDAAAALQEKSFFATRFWQRLKSRCEN